MKGGVRDESIGREAGVVETPNTSCVSVDTTILFVGAKD